MLRAKEKKPDGVANAPHYRFQSKVVAEYVRKGLLTEEAAMQLTEAHITNLQTLAVQKFVASGHLSVQHAARLTLVQRCNLMSLAVCQRISEGRMTIDEALGLSFEGRRVIQAEVEPSHQSNPVVANENDDMDVDEERAAVRSPSF